MPTEPHGGGAGDPSSAHSQDVRIVTISASYGAGGSVIGPLLARRLNLPFADRLIVARGGEAPQPGAESVTEEEHRQVSRERLLTRLAHVTGGMGMPVPTGSDIVDPVRVRVEESIDQLVASGGAVILGRAAAVVLAGHPQAFHVRLDGPPQRRIAHGMRIETCDETTAQQRLNETDRARAKYVERLYGRDAADPGLYHVWLDSTVLSADACVELIAQAASAFWTRG